MTTNDSWISFESTKNFSYSHMHQWDQHLNFTFNLFQVSIHLRLVQYYFLSSILLSSTNSDTRNVLLILGMFFFTSILAPSMWYLWIYAGMGNANFFYAVTLAYNTAQVSFFLLFLLQYMYVCLSVRLFLSSWYQRRHNIKQPNKCDFCWEYMFRSQHFFPYQKDFKKCKCRLTMKVVSSRFLN